MTVPLAQHQTEIQANLSAWQNKPLLQRIYAGFYERILALIDPATPGRIVEIGSGIGNLKGRLPGALATDLFPNPWLDVVCDGYELPFPDGSLSHVILFDVFHHLQAPDAFLREARRTLVRGGRLVVFDPFLSWFSHPVYGLLHHEPLAWRRRIEFRETLPRPRAYYAAQGNATRLFFRKEKGNWPPGWTVLHAEAFAAFHYLFSGGFSKPSVYPAAWMTVMQKCDRFLSRWPRCFGARCLVVLQPV